MDSILSRGKEFEYLVTTFDPLFDRMVAAVDIVKQFIIDNGLIVYGGTAIDYALRLKGDKIYPDDLLKVPDLDFYSPTNVEHAYQLADLLFLRGYREVRAINAQHTETMRVDIADNHFIADISYRPLEVFNALPYLIYDGIRIIHPDFQRVDVHSSLSFPYDNSPREVIFERWSKDIKRFNKLAEHYPVTASRETLPTRTASTTLHGYVFTGMIAYALLYAEFERLIGARDDVVAAKFTAKGPQLTFDAIDQACEIVHFDPEKALETINYSKVGGIEGVMSGSEDGKNVSAKSAPEGLKYKHYESYINLLPERYECATRGSGKLVIYSTKNRLLAADTIRVTAEGTEKGYTVCRITNIQYLLKHFLAMFFMHKDSPKLAGTYLARYTSLLNMIGAVEAKYTAGSSSAADVSTAIADSSARLFFPTINTYGNENINLAREIALNRLYNDLNDTPLYKIPPNYYPVRAKLRGVGHPPFTPRDLVFFRNEGLEIIDSAL